MKSLIALAVLVFSFNSFAAPSKIILSTVYVTAPTTGLSSIISGSELNFCKEAQELLEDANDYYLSGALTPALESHINHVQELNEVSDQEAVDMLVATAQEILIANQKN